MTEVLKIAKIAISLPEAVLEAVEKERLQSGESRSEFFRRAVKILLHREQAREAIEQYIRSYREQPETEEELGWLEEASRGVLAEYPWEDKNRG